MQKARRYPNPKIKASTACKRMVSESFHSLSQGSFHLSLTVLVHYRSLSSIQAYQMVLVDSDKVSPASPYSGYCQVMHSFRLRDFHPLWYLFPQISTKNASSTTQSYNPDEHAHRFGLFRVRSPLLTESLLVFFSSAYLDVSVQRVHDYCLYVFNIKGFPIRTSTDQGSFAPPRCFSQLTTSFVVSGSQGIPHTLLFRFQILRHIFICPNFFIATESI